MERRRFTREFKLEAVKLVTERGVRLAQASRDLDVDSTVLRRWVKEFGSDPQQAFPGHGQQKADQAEIARLRREVAKLKAERDILKRMARPVRKDKLLDGEVVCINVSGLRDEPWPRWISARPSSS